MSYHIARTVYDWQDDALCSQVGTEAWFPPKGGSAVEAKKVCARCDVRDQCLDYALRTHQREGIWGGLSSRERARLLRGAA